MYFIGCGYGYFFSVTKWFLLVLSVLTKFGASQGHLQHQGSLEKNVVITIFIGVGVLIASTKTTNVITYRLSRKSVLEFK